MPKFPVTCPGMVSRSNNLNPSFVVNWHWFPVLVWYCVNLSNSENCLCIFDHDKNFVWYNNKCHRNYQTTVSTGRGGRAECFQACDWSVASASAKSICSYVCQIELWQSINCFVGVLNKTTSRKGVNQNFNRTSDDISIYLNSNLDHGPPWEKKKDVPKGTARYGS